MPRSRPMFVRLLLPCLLLATPLVADTLPWRQAGLDQRQAAAHLLDRFAYGARPGDVDRIVAQGLETWLDGQLAAQLQEPSLTTRLGGLVSLQMPLEEIYLTYPNPGQVLRQARAAGTISDQDLAGREDAQAVTDAAGGERRRARGGREVMAFARQQGYRSQRRLLSELMTQKLYRAVYGENQLQAVLTDFWFNHFNVSLTDKDVRGLLTAYERDAIRPHVLGDFDALLVATAKHPAMLLYLDNARSVAASGVATTLDRRRRQAVRSGSRGSGGQRRGGGRRGRFANPRGQRRQAESPPPTGRRLQGLNENYARELLELHTLGVDGGYEQQDVVEVARAFTGWTVLPPAKQGNVQSRSARLGRMGDRAGFVVEGNFIFRANAHDAEAKMVLGQRLPAGRGIEDGLEVLGLLAGHRSTAEHLATKLAIRFVADRPPTALVERLAAVFLDTGGDLQKVMRTLAYAPEFWAAGYRHGKIKTPFELVSSALRATAAEIDDPQQLIDWLRRLGQLPYAYQAPTGYPDTADAWVNTGALLQRMSFGLQLGNGSIDGVRLDLATLDGGREPESLAAALASYVPLLLPERDARETVRLLQSMVGEHQLAARLEARAPEAEKESPPPANLEDLFDDAAPLKLTAEGAKAGSLGQVVGVILGAPEFQRR